MTSLRRSPDGQGTDGQKAKGSDRGHAFCGGVLVTWRTFTPSPHYDARGGTGSGDGLSIGFYDGTREARVETVEALLAIGKDRGGSLERAAAANPGGIRRRVQGPVRPRSPSSS